MPTTTDDLTGQARAWRPTSDTPGAPAYPERTGWPVTILRPLTPAEAETDETGPMYRVRFPDGTETDAFEDELGPGDPYRIAEHAAKHTCWDDPTWDGTMPAEGECTGCDQATKHPCRFCGYGHIFTTHNDLAHAENADTHLADTMGATDTEQTRWANSPHIYETTQETPR